MTYFNPNLKSLWESRFILQRLQFPDSFPQRHLQQRGCKQVRTEDRHIKAMMYVKENGRIIVTKNPAREITENAAFLFTVYT